MVSKRHEDRGTCQRTWTRREVLAAAAALPLALPARAQDLAPKAGPSAGAEPFAFVALGDVHFDRPEHHDMEWLRREHPSDVAQVANYSRITGEVTPQLFGVIRRLAADPPGGVRVRFAAQLGDFVEGMCGAPGLALRQCEDAVGFVQRAELGIPFHMSKGNHEIQGPGASEAFNRVLLPALCGPGRRTAGPASFTLEQGAALLAFLDAYDPGALDWLERTFRSRAPRHRHLFVLLHPPVVPFGARATWHLYSGRADAARRARLLSLLGAHRAIVLSAHLHKFGVVVRRTDTGRFLQLALASVLPRPDVRPRDVVSGVERYGPDLVRLEPTFSPQTEAARREALQAEAPFITHFAYADAPGYALLTVREESVVATVHVGLAPEPWMTLDVTELLAG
jgi:hypothetical protein